MRERSRADLVARFLELRRTLRQSPEDRVRAEQALQASPLGAPLRELTDAIDGSAELPLKRKREMIKILRAITREVSSGSARGASSKALFGRLTELASGTA